MRFEPKHVVTMVVAVSAAAVLFPVGVMAASGVSITDPFSSARVARVSSDGSLRVESRAAASSKTYSFQAPPFNTIGFLVLREFGGADRTAITEMSFAAGMFNASNEWSYDVSVWGLARTSGSAACKHDAPGWSKRLLRRVEIRIGSTVALGFAGSPLLLPPSSASQKQCLGIELHRSITGASLSVGGSGYRYTP